jgi:hypothetical protein
VDADLDTLYTVIYCTADDLLPEARKNARRRITDAELVTLCVAQAIMGIPSDRRFLAVARTRLVHLFPDLPHQAGYFKRRRRLADASEWLMAHFASQSPGYHDDLLLIDSTPLPCATSRETVKRSALAELAGYGYCASHSRWYWGLRLHALCAPDGTPRALALAAPSRDEREVGLELLARCRRGGCEVSSATRATRAVSSRRRSPSSAPRWCARSVRTSPVAVLTWRPSASESSRSSGPARTCSPWSATGRAPWSGCVGASWRASSASRPASASTTGWDDRVVLSSTTAPEAVGVESSI